jgi:CMP-N-acetylneuraminic acid synthetase
MTKKIEILAVITARGGSKRIPGKNIKLLNGKPLIGYVIAAALASKHINRVIVSTDDKKIVNIARKYKAEVPFIRPKDLASDNSTSLSVLQHAVKYLDDKESYMPDFVVLLQPTSPFVLPADIDRTIEKIMVNKTNSCVTICEASEKPNWMVNFTKKGSDIIKPFYKNIQGKLPSLVYRINGAVYVTKIDVLMKHHKIIDENSTSAVVMPMERSVDIDLPLDFIMAEVIIKYANNKSLSKRIKRYD